MRAEPEAHAGGSALPPPPPARVPGNRWTDLEAPEIGRWAPRRPVSVVIPCYQDTGPLALTLAALSCQTYPRHLTQIVIADDGSDPPIRIGASETLDGIDIVVARQERRGFGLARARNTGATAAGGDILVFIDADMVPEPIHLEAHARWHHAVADAATIGFRTHVEFAGISPAAVRAAAEGGSLEPSLSGRELRSPDWIEAQMQRTDDLTSGDDDLFRILTGGNVGVRAETFNDSGRFDESFEQYGGEDTEIGYRLFASGALLVPERRALCWHQGLKEVIDPAEARSGTDQRGKLAQLIPQRGFRRFMPGRSYRVPAMVVRVAVGGEAAPQVTRVVESVLANRFHDLMVCLSVPPEHPERVWLERQFEGDPRVVVGDGLDGDRLFPWAAFRVEVPPAAQLSAEALEAVVDRMWEQSVGAVEVTVPGAPSAPPIRAFTTRALRRAARLNPDEPEPLAAELFGLSRIPGGDLGVIAYHSKMPLPSPTPPSAGAARLRDEAETLAKRVSTLTDRLEQAQRELARLRRRGRPGRALGRIRRAIRRRA